MTRAQIEIRTLSEQYLRAGIVVAIVMHAAALALWPPYVPQVYKLDDDAIKLINLTREFQVSPPPKEIPRPQIPMEAALTDDVDDDFTINRTVLTPGELAAIPPPPPPTRHIVFHAFAEEPKAILIPKPRYPRIAREAELEGWVLVQVLVDVTGGVESAVVLQSSSGLFDESAIEAARRARFHPGTQRGEPVPCLAKLRFRFTLR